MSPSSDTTPDIALAVADPLPVRKLRRSVLVGFASTVIFGLAMAGWYVGDRIYAADGPQARPVAIPQVSQPVEREPAAQLIKLPIPEFYLQVAALGSEQDQTYLKRLQSRGFPARLEATSILIGPYTARADLNRAERKLTASGILATEVDR